MNKRIDKINNLLSNKRNQALLKKQDLVLILCQPESDLMIIDHFNFKGSIEEGMELIKNHPNNIYIQI